MTEKQTQRTDLLIVNALETAKQLRELQDSPVAEAIFESIVENENGKEIQFERPISDLAYAAFLKIERLVEALESAEKLIAELEALQSFRTAFNEWHDKTEWMQGDKRFDVIKPWGKHRADVLKLYIDHLESSLKSRLLTNADRDIAALRQRIADQQGIILSARQFISEYAASGDAGADEFVKVIDRAAGINMEDE